MEISRVRFEKKIRNQTHGENGGNATMKKPSIGKTSIHLHYYKTGEYRNLTREQKDELREWRANNPNISKAGFKKAKKEMPKKPKPPMKKLVASLVETG